MPNTESKKFWLSKIFWVNILAIGGLILQSQVGFVFSAEGQLAVLGVINILLRAITKTEIKW